jgi:hypothetical protein
MRFGFVTRFTEHLINYFYGPEQFFKHRQLCIHSKTSGHFYATRRFITVCTKALHWYLSSARSIQSIQAHPRSILILSTPYVFVFLVVSFLLASTPISYMYSFPPHSCYMPCSFYELIILGELYKLWSSSLRSPLQRPVPTFQLQNIMSIFLSLGCLSNEPV